MENDSPSSGKSYPLSRAKLSKTPSWIMLGFVLGAAFIIALPPLRKPAPAAPPERIVEVRSAPREAPPLTTIEAVFAAYGRDAVWSDDVTEVALWNVKERAFSEFYEVRRVGGAFYFRTLPRLTRRIIARGRPQSDVPLQFTETEEQYREWLAYGRTERTADLEPVVPRRPAREELAPPANEPGRRPAPPVLEVVPPVKPSLDAPVPPKP